MKFQLVSIVDGKVMVETFTADNVMPAMEVRNYPYTGPCKRKSLRAELQGMPMFSGALGPMWGGLDNGEPVIRYETQKVYDALST